MFKSAKYLNLRGSSTKKVYFVKVNMCLYLLTKFIVSNITLTRLREAGGSFNPLPPSLFPTSKRTSKRLTKTRVQRCLTCQQSSLITHHSSHFWTSVNTHHYQFFFRISHDTALNFLDYCPEAIYRPQSLIQEFLEHFKSITRNQQPS